MDTETAMAAHDRQVVLIRAGHCRTGSPAFLQAGRERTAVVQTPWTLAQIAAQSPLVPDFRSSHPTGCFGQDMIRPLYTWIVLQLREGHEGSKMQARLILVHIPQCLDASQTYQAFVVHHIVFQLPEQITAASDKTGLLSTNLEKTYSLFQGRGLDKLKRSHTMPFLWIAGSWLLTFYP